MHSLVFFYYYKLNYLANHYFVFQSLKITKLFTGYASRTTAEVPRCWFFHPDSYPPLSAASRMSRFELWVMYKQSLEPQVELSFRNESILIFVETNSVLLKELVLVMLSIEYVAVEVHWHPSSKFGVPKLYVLSHLSLRSFPLHEFNEGRDFSRINWRIFLPVWGHALEKCDKTLYVLIGE